MPASKTIWYCEVDTVHFMRQPKKCLFYEQDECLVTRSKCSAIEFALVPMNPESNNTKLRQIINYLETHPRLLGNIIGVISFVISFIIAQVIGYTLLAAINPTIKIWAMIGITIIGGVTIGIVAYFIIKVTIGGKLNAST